MGQPLDACIIVCSAPPFVRDVVNHLQKAIEQNRITFVWSCESTIVDSSGESRGESVVSLGLTGLRVFRENRTSVKGGDTERSFAVALQLSLDGAWIGEQSDRSLTVESGMQKVSLRFPTDDILERFVQHFAKHTPDGATREGRSSSVTSTNTVKSTDGRVPRVVKHEQTADTLHSADTDYFHVASNKAFCAKARHKWHKWTTRVKSKGHEGALFHVGERGSSERGLSSVLLSMDCQLGPETHEIAVVTDVALFVVKRRDPSIVKLFLPVIGIEAVQMASSSRATQGGDSVVEWEVMVVLDLQVPVTTLSTDAKLRMDNRSKNLFVSLLSRQYEALRLQRLPVTVQEDTIFWRKRTLFETKMIRVANKLRSGVLSATGATAAANKMDEDVALGLREALVDHTEAFVHALCWHSVTQVRAEDPEELGFVARSLLGSARRCSVVREVILSAVSFELSRVCGQQASKRTADTVGTHHHTTGFFRSKSLVDYLIAEHCMHVGEQYLRIQLAQMMEEFVSSTASDSGSEPMGETECLRYVRELATVLCDSAHNDALFPDPIREIMCMVDVVLAHNTAQLRVPHDWHPRDDFVAHVFIGRAVEAPQTHGLVSEELSVAQLRKLRLISRVFQRLTSCQVPESARGCLADHPLDDHDSNTIARFASSSAFSSALAMQPQLHKFMQRLTADGQKREMRAAYTTMRSAADSAALRSGKVARPPLLESDVKVLRMMHSLIERRAASLMCAAFGLRYRVAALSLEPRSTAHLEPHLSKPTGEARALADENAQLRGRITSLEKVVAHTKAQLVCAVESSEEMEMTVRLKHDEVSHLRKQLRDYDAHYFPRPDDAPSSAPPMLQEEGMPLYRYFGSSPRGVFACPLDSFATGDAQHDHYNYSPVDGRKEMTLL